MLLLALTAFADPGPIPAWFGGCWEAEGFRETWLGPEGGLMVGAALSVDSRGEASWEHLWLGPVEGHLAYVAHPAGQERTVFPATELTADRAVFENPEHDFPQRITYAQRDGGLAVRVEARDGDAWKGFDLAFRRCAAPAEGTKKRKKAKPGAGG